MMLDEMSVWNKMVFETSRLAGVCGVLNRMSISQNMLSLRARRSWNLESVTQRCFQRIKVQWIMNHRHTL